MPKRILLLVVVLAALFAASVESVIAQTPIPCAPPFCVFVDATLTTGNEDGSQGNPYSELKEGKYYAQSQPNGAYIYIKKDNIWLGPTKIAAVVSGGGGSPLPDVTIYALLAILAVILILLGRRFQHQSQ